MNKLEDVKLGDFGRVAEVTITKDDCLLIKVHYIAVTSRTALFCLVLNF